MHHTGQYQRHRLAQVYQPSQFRRGEYRVDLAAVLVQQRRVRFVRQESSPVCRGQRFVVHVDDPVVGSQPARYLVNVAHGRQSRTEVDELPDPRCEGMVDRATQEHPALPHRGGDAGYPPLGTFHELSLDTEVVAAPEEGVGDSCAAGARQVQLPSVSGIVPDHAHILFVSSGGAALQHYLSKCSP
ncbi:hypothetical protein GCM10027444_17540 [Actinopolyspora lacussalsi]